MKKKIQKPCINCGRLYYPLSNGLCKPCYVYQRRTGQSRPPTPNRIINVARGSASPAWKGDVARAETKRARAQRIYPLGICQNCGKPATERHHIDRDTGNNQSSNILILCRRCHMQMDGRLTEFLSHRIDNSKPPEPCKNCGRLSKPLRKGLCHSCNEYQRRNGKPRPYIQDGRSEKVFT